MKTIITSGFTSFFSSAISLATVNIRPILSDITAVIGICSGILAMWLFLVNIVKARKETAKLDLEMDEYIRRKCKDCTDPENCAFAKQHRPPDCKHRTST